MSIDNQFHGDLEGASKGQMLAVGTDIQGSAKNAQGLRQAILRHAFTGKLVPQDPNDEPASELLKRIATERESRRAPISRRHRAAS